MEQAKISVPMQTQVLIWMGTVACSLTAGIALLILVSGVAATPFLILAVLAAANGGRIYHIAVRSHYLVLAGTVLKVERTGILRRPKAVLMEAEGKALRVMLRSCYKTPAEGSRIAFYVQDSTPIYKWRGIHLLDSYLAMAAENPSGKAF